MIFPYPQRTAIDHKIVTLNQHHVPPIVRVKAGKNTEFRGKVSASCIARYVFLDRISWDNYNVSGNLKATVKELKNYTGHYRSLPRVSSCRPDL